jgi:hypothetical protein
MATKKAGKQTAKPAYGSAGATARKLEKKSGVKKGGKAAGGGGGGGGESPPAEEPIIIGGGSINMLFEKKFKVKPHSKHHFKHENDTKVILQVVFLTGMGGTVTRRIPLNRGERAVAICYTGSKCP